MTAAGDQVAIEVSRDGGISWQGDSARRTSPIARTLRESAQWEDAATGALYRRATPPSAECIHGLGPVEACVECNGRAARERADQADAWRTFPARYESQCPACDLPIGVGDLIAWKPDAKPIHEGCRP